MALHVCMCGALPACFTIMAAQVWYVTHYLKTFCPLAVSLCFSRSAFTARTPAAVTELGAAGDPSAE